jgi:uncharacterized protein with beta-barrel porin domain
MASKKSLSHKITFLFFLTYIILFVFFYNSNVKAVDCRSIYSASETLTADCTVPSGGTTINSGVTITSGSYQLDLDTGNFVNNGTVTSTSSYTINKNSAGSGTMTNFTNTGTISSTNSGYQVSFQNGATLTNFNNSGTISTAAYGMVLSSNVTITNFTNSGTIITSEYKGIILQSNSTITNFYNYGTISGGGISEDIGFHSLNSSIVNLYNDQPDLVFYGKNPDNYYIKVNSTSDYGALKAHSTDAMTFAGIDSSSSLSVGTYSNVVTNISSSYISAASGTFGGYEWSFVNSSGTQWDLVVTAAADTTAPTLSSSSPADNATDVARDANIILNFSESVDVESGNITIKKTSDNSTVETFNVATSGQITGTGTSQITINPSSDLFGGFEYYVLIDATAFDDSAGNSYAGISSTTALSFTVVDMQNPTTNKDVVGSIDTQSQLAKSSIFQSTSTVSSRLSYLRQNKDSNDLTENNIKLGLGNATFTSLANELLAKNDKSIIPDNWSSWSEGSISISKIGDSTNSSSSETDGQALAIGFDTKLNDNDLLGFAIQYGKSDTDVGSSGTNVDSENINVSVYRTRPLDNDNFIEGMFGVGLIESDLTRISGSNTLTGSRNGTQIFGSINYGKTLDKGDFNLTPIARVDLGYTELDAYSETGTDALTYAKQTIESGLASVGLEFSDIVKFNNNKLKPFGSIEYGMDFSNSSDAKMNYVSDTSTIYTYTQGANSNHLITSVVGFEYITINNLNIISSYKRIQGNESEQTDIINVSINFKSKRETEYAMSIDGSEDLKAGFDISKNINGFDLKFNANQAFNENSDQAANVSLSRSF